MDFTLTDEQQAIAELAHRILSEQLPPERLRELERTESWFADDVWAGLGQADLLGIALPEARRWRWLRDPRGLPDRGAGRSHGRPGAIPEQHRGFGDAPRPLRQRGAAIAGCYPM